MSQAPQLPEQPATPCPSEQSAPPSASRVSCTAHLMPSFCMFLLVDISESMLCPLITRTLPDGRELLYNEEDLRNPWFVCRSKFSKI